jgi:hypothetical protein
VHREKLKNKEPEEVENTDFSPQPMDTDPNPNHVPFITNNPIVEDPLKQASLSSPRKNLRSTRLQ